MVVEGGSSSQPAEAKANTQSTSHQLGMFRIPCGQMRGQGLRNQRIHTHLMEMMLSLKHTIEQNLMDLTTRHLQQDLVLEEQRHSQVVSKKEALLGQLMYQLVNLLQSGAVGGLELQPSCPSLDVSGDVRGGQGAQSSRQPDWLVHRLSNPEATFVSQYLSSRGIDISVLYHSSFQDYKTYQRDKYHEDQNILVRMGV
ncbi:probable inactive 1-aminocyclopropane-1-carboxylate synthase-like protein 2 [Hyaena hyaena]|uniref:probable inactive 1-aminocyclopropane-1-carboxylate synthase-like protein 2 n=1 Tax=Hyaena hyaena TaxID=95912 RepID=UPI0019216ACD|nr:probable inactive 1-aminocyclopropane-1-carboxylate synthase-like protein 2 [Hyaena hyaena]